MSFAARALVRGARQVAAASGIARAAGAAPAAVGFQKMSFANAVEKEVYCRQRPSIILENRVPVISVDARVAGNAVIVGDVDIDDKVSIWHGAVLRGDLNFIRVQPYAAILERAVLHAARSSPTGMSAGTSVGRYSSIGARSVLRSATVQDEVVVGNGCILMEGSLVETHAILMAGTVVPPGRRIPSGEMWGGNPAQYIRDVTKDEIMDIPVQAERYFDICQEYEDEKFDYNGVGIIEAEAIREAISKPEA